MGNVGLFVKTNSSANVATITAGTHDSGIKHRGTKVAGCGANLGLRNQSDWAIFNFAGQTGSGSRTTNEWAAVSNIPVANNVAIIRTLVVGPGALTLNSTNAPSNTGIPAFGAPIVLTNGQSGAMPVYQ